MEKNVFCQNTVKSSHFKLGLGIHDIPIDQQQRFVDALCR